jgi:hypothetical protein
MMVAALMWPHTASAASDPSLNGNAPKLVEWTDPTEHAFTVKVPQGWKINGGTKWQGPITPRGYVMYSMLASVALDKEWEAKKNRKVQDVTGNVIKMQNAMTQAALSRAREQAANSLARLNHPNEGVKGLGRNKDSDDRLSTQRSNTTLGTKRVCDDLGDCKTVDNSHDHYWKDHSGRVIPGPASGGPPDNTGVWRPMHAE